MAQTSEIAEQFSENPTASIPEACGGWAETAAAYRFLAQDKRDWSDIMSSLGSVQPSEYERAKWCCAFRTPPS